MRLPSLRSQSVPIAIGFATGQGSAFLIQLYVLKTFTKEYSAFVSLMVGVFSFALQFSDVGNVIRYNKLFAVNREPAVLGFAAGRALWGFLFSLILIVGIERFTSIEGFSNAMLIFAPIAAMVFSISGLGRLEATGSYWRYSASQAITWLTFGIVIAALSQASEVRAMPSLLVFGILAGSVAMCIACRQLDLPTKLHGAFTVSALLFRASLPFIWGQIAAQVWGRVIIIAAAAVLGVHGLTEFTLTRQVQIAVLTGFGFIVRPHVRAFAIAHAENSVSDLRLAIKFGSRLWKVLFLSVIVVLVLWISSSYQLLGSVSEHLAQYLPLFAAIPILIIGTAAIQLLYISGSRRFAVATEVAALAINICIFFFAYDHSFALALALAEGASSCIALIGLALWLRRPPR